jgi:hypothetical protein
MINYVGWNQYKLVFQINLLTSSGQIINLKFKRSSLSGKSSW